MGLRTVEGVNSEYAAKNTLTITGYGSKTKSILFIDIRWSINVIDQLFSKLNISQRDLRLMFLELEQ